MAGRRTSSNWAGQSKWHPPTCASSRWLLNHPGRRPGREPTQILARVQWQAPCPPAIANVTDQRRTRESAKRLVRGRGGEPAADGIEVEEMLRDRSGGRGARGGWGELTRWVGERGNFWQKGQMVNIVSRDLRNKLTSDTSAISKTSRDVSEASVCRRFHRARGTRRDLCRTETRGRQFRQHRIPARPHRIAGHRRGQRYFRQTWEAAGHREIKIKATAARR